jgi:hypothetical protein
MMKSEDNPTNTPQAGRDHSDESIAALPQQRRPNPLDSDAHPEEPISPSPSLEGLAAIPLPSTRVIVNTRDTLPGFTACPTGSRGGSQKECNYLHNPLGAYETNLEKNPAFSKNSYVVISFREYVKKEYVGGPEVIKLTHMPAGKGVLVCTPNPTQDQKDILKVFESEEKLEGFDWTIDRNPSKEEVENLLNENRYRDGKLKGFNGFWWSCEIGKWECRQSICRVLIKYSF